MQKELIYRNIAMAGGILLLLTVFFDFLRPIENNFYEFAYDFTWMTTMTFAFLWYRKVVLLVGLLLILVEFNISLLFNPIFEINDPNLLTSSLKKIGNIFLIAGFICLIIGLWDMLKIKYLKNEINVGIIPLISFIVIITVIVQIVF